MLKLSCWVSCLVSRELNYFQYGFWNTSTVVLNGFHKGCIYTMPLSTTRSESTRQKILKNFTHLFKKNFTELILSADILAKGPPSWLYRSWRQRAEWTLRNTCLLYTTSVEYPGEEGSFSIHSFTLFIPAPQARPSAYSQEKDGRIGMLRKTKEFLTSEFPGDVPSHRYFQNQLDLPGLTMPTDLRIQHPPEIRPHCTSRFHCYL